MLAVVCQPKWHTSLLSLVACGMAGAWGGYIGIRLGAIGLGRRTRAFRLGPAALGCLTVLAVSVLLWYDPFPMASLDYGGRSHLGFALAVLPILSGALFGVRAVVRDGSRSRVEWVGVLAWLLLVPAFLLVALCFFIELAGGLRVPSFVAYGGLA